MAEKRPVEAEEMKSLVELKATPEIEKALAEQMRTLPEAIKPVEPRGRYAASCFGLVVCCIGASASMLEAG